MTTLPSLVRYDPYFDPADLSDPKVVELREAITWPIFEPQDIARLEPRETWGDADYVIVQVAREEVGLAPTPDAPDNPERWWT